METNKEIEQSIIEDVLEIRKQDKRWNELVAKWRAETNPKKKAYLEAQANNRCKVLIVRYMKDVSKKKATLREAMEMMPDNERTTFTWKMALAFFLMDFLEDTFMKMESMLKKHYKNQNLENLSDLFKMRRFVSKYMLSAMEDVTEDGIQAFDEAAADIKNTIHNKVRAYVRQEQEREAMEKTQMTIVF